MGIDIVERVNKELFQLLPETVLIVDRHGTIVDINKRVEESLGYSPEEIRGKHFTQMPFMTSKGKALAMAKFAQRMLGQKVAPYELEIKTKTGEIVVGRVTGHAIKNDEGKEIGTVVMVAVVTALERRRLVVETEKEQIGRYFDLAGTMLVVLNNQGRVVQANKKTLAVLDRSEVEVVGKDWFEVALPDEEREKVKQEFIKIISGEAAGAESFENQIMTQSGERRLIRWRNTILTGSDGLVSGTLSAGEDVTEEQATEEKLNQSRQQWKLLFENAPDAYYLIDNKATIYEVNQKTLEMIGYTREELVGKNGLQLGLIPKMRVKKVLELLALNAMGKHTGPDEITIQRRDGSLLEVEAVVQPVTINNKKLILGIARDIGQRKKAEGELRDHQAKLALAMETAGMANWEYDVARDTFTFNDRFYALYGTSAAREGGYQMASKVYTKKFVYPDDRELVRVEIAELLITKDPHYSRQIDHRIVRADGVVRYISVRFKGVFNDEGKLERTIGANQDITERKLNEIAIARREKTMSVLNASMERFLKSSVANWDENVQHYLSQAGKELKTARVFLIKHRMVDATGVEGYLRFEWAKDESRQLRGKPGAETIRVVREEHQPWFDAVASKKAVKIPLEKMPQWWRGSLCSPEAKRLILAAVYVDDYWWGVLGIEDYDFVAVQSEVELEAFGSMAVLFGSAVARKWADERLIQFELGIERSNDVVFLTDPEGKIEYINQTFSTVYGYSLDEVRGKTPRVLKSGKQSVAFYEKFWSILKSGQALKAEFINRTKDGRLVTMAASVSPITDKTGEMIGYLAIQRDITEAKEKELWLKASYEELERLNKLMVGRELKMRELKETIRELQVAQNGAEHGSS